MIARELVPLPTYAMEVAAGLSNCPKTLPSKLFYDATGSALFEDITRLPEYYLTRAELEILRERAGEIRRTAGPDLTVVELGAGTATKTCTFLRAVAEQQARVAYWAVDISRAALQQARQQIRRECPGVDMQSVLADMSQGFGFLRDIVGPKLVLYLGSSIGNFEHDVAASMLRRVRDELAKGDALLLGADLAKDPAILVPAYDDARGVTAKFNKNMLIRLNVELGTNFDLDSFRHVACWNAAASRIEMHLESTRAQTVRADALNMQFNLRSGERIHTENSYKYTDSMIRDLLKSAGFSLEKSWLDHRKWFALNLARV